MGGDWQVNVAGIVVGVMSTEAAGSMSNRMGERKLGAKVLRIAAGEAVAVGMRELLLHWWM